MNAKRLACHLPTALLGLASTLAIATPVAAQDLKTFNYALLTQSNVHDTVIYVGMDKGYFADEGLALELMSPATPADGLKLVAAGNVDLATAHSTDVIIARSRELPVVSIGTNHQHGVSGIMVPAESGVETLADLEGMTLGVTGIPYNQVMLQHALNTAGVDSSKVTVAVVGFNQIPLLLSDRIQGLGDAIEWSELATYNVAIDNAADDPTTFKFFKFTDFGVPRFYTLGLVASAEALDADPETYEGFLAAWSKSVAWMIDNQEEAVDILLAHVPEVNRDEALFNLGVIADLSVAENGTIGWQDPAIWQAQADFMFENGQLETEVDVTEAVTNDYLPD